jgi:hypothetical protein
MSYGLVVGVHLAPQAEACDGWWVITPHRVPEST